MRAAVFLVLAAFVAGVLLVAACGNHGETIADPPLGVQVPGRVAEFNGTITQLDRSDDASGSMLVEEKPGTQEGDKFLASIGIGTPVARKGADGSITAASWTDLAKDQQVQVWVDGPVLESYPAQGGASFVLIVA
jgi:hypothetical protein